MLRLPLVQCRGASLKSLGNRDQPGLAGGWVYLWFHLLISRSLYRSLDSSWPENWQQPLREYLLTPVFAKSIYDFFHLHAPLHSYAQLCNLKRIIVATPMQRNAHSPSVNSTGDNIRSAPSLFPPHGDASPLALPCYKPATEVTILSTRSGWHSMVLSRHGLMQLSSSLASPRGVVRELFVLYFKLTSSDKLFLQFWVRAGGWAC